jgi:thiamine transport system substrate-binding protein
VIYTYDSFVSFGPAAEIEARFEAQTGIDIQFVATNDSRSMLARLLTERAGGGTPADVFIGVEVNDLVTAAEESAFIELSEQVVPNLADIASDLQFDPQNRLLPYEHGFITLVYDSAQISEDELPISLEDLADTRFRNQLLIQDPRTSSPGLSFLLWTIHEFGDPGYLDYWERLLPNVLTIAPGWGEAFTLFAQGEAPFLVSFSTDNAFDQIINGRDNIRVLTLNGQGYRTIFGVGVVDTSDQSELAIEFVNFLLSEEIQSLLPTSEWMFPANVNAQLPEAFAQFAVLPENSVSLAPENVAESLEAWLRAWTNVASQ